MLSNVEGNNPSLFAVLATFGVDSQAAGDASKVISLTTQCHLIIKRYPIVLYLGFLLCTGTYTLLHEDGI